METKEYLNILKKEIHSTVFATVDADGLPATKDRENILIFPQNKLQDIVLALEINTKWKNKLNMDILSMRNVLAV